MSERIYTRCPACQNDTLTINKGRLLCTWHECKDPISIDQADKTIPALMKANDELRNQLAEAQREHQVYKDVLNEAFKDISDSLHSNENFNLGIKRVVKERDQLKQQLADVQDMNTKLVTEANRRDAKWQTGIEEVLGEKLEWDTGSASRGREASVFLRERFDSLKQQLLACEASRERMKPYCAHLEDCRISPKHDCDCGFDSLLSTSPQTALTEALKPVREALEETSETLSCLGTFYRHSPIWEQIKVENKIKEAKQALSELDKLCPKGD